VDGLFGPAGLLTINSAGDISVGHEAFKTLDTCLTGCSCSAIPTVDFAKALYEVSILTETEYIGKINQSLPLKIRFVRGGALQTDVASLSAAPRQLVQL
jgi:hypothetical protein